MLWMNILRRRSTQIALLSMTSAIIGLCIVAFVLAPIVVHSKIASHPIRLDDAQFKLLKEYYSQLHHLRDPYVKWAGRTQNLMFSTVNSHGKNSGDILIQGDSWAEQLVHNKASLSLLENYGRQKRVGIIVGGTTSYAPTVMTAQLRILRSEFKIEPSVIVAVLDHTDIGDELCRYRDLVEFSNDGNVERVRPEPYNSSEPMALKKSIQNREILFGEAQPIVKLFKIAFYRAKNIVFRNAAKRCGWSKISEPLKKGISEQDHEYIKSIIKSYIRRVFSNGRVQKLLFVIHPHKLHNAIGHQKYKFYWNQLLVKTVAEVDENRNIEILDFQSVFPSIYLDNKIDNRDIYARDDPASHLSKSAYPLFAKRILQHVDQFQVWK